MKTYSIHLKVTANSTAELEEKMQAFQDLQDHLEHEDLLSAVDVLIDNPDIVDFIKEVAPAEGKELSMGDYISIAKKAFVKFS